MRYVVVILVHLLLVGNPHLQIHLVVPSSAGYQVHHCVRPNFDCISSSWSQCDEPFSEFMHAQQCICTQQPRS